jgi:hypothetical protein
LEARLQISSKPRNRKPQKLGLYLEQMTMTKQQSKEPKRPCPRCARPLREGEAALAKRVGCCSVCGPGPETREESA